MTVEDAIEEVIEAKQLIDIAYKKMMNVCRAYREKNPYIETATIKSGKVSLMLVVAENEFQKMEDE